MQILLVLNAGSSSLKFQVFDQDDISRPLATGRITGIGTQPVFSIAGEQAELPTSIDQSQALERILAWVERQPEDWQLSAIGHRIVHGGNLLSHQLLDESVIEKLDALVPLAPLHQPHHLHAIRYLRRRYPNLPQVGCFDTVFHAGQKPLHKAFAIPRSYFNDGIKRYGFHGLSYEWMTHRLRENDPKLYQGRIVAAHLGNGASLCAIQNGKSIVTTMGMTAIDGLPMGTRSGAIDAGAMLYLIRERGMSPEAVEHMLSYESGLLGLSGLSNDMRELRAAENSNADAAFAIQFFTQKVIQNIAAMAAAMGGMDALLLSGGIGENDEKLAADINVGLQFMPAYEKRVIPANEEAMIAIHTQAIIRQMAG